MNKTGDGSDLYDDWFDVFDLYNAMRDVENSRSRYLLVEEDEIDQVRDED